MSQTAPLTQWEWSCCSSRSSSDYFPTMKSGVNLRPWPSSRIRTRFFRKNISNPSSFCCRCSVTSGEDAAAGSTSGSNTSGGGSSSDWNWNRWTRHFTEIEQAESDVSRLKFQLEDAVEREDFQEAVRLKSAIFQASSKDCVAEIMSAIKKAINEERYHDATKLSNSTASCLVGWWVGYSRDSDDPFGRFVRITRGVRRFIARSYSPRQLITASPGTPLFAIYVVKDNYDSYSVQAVCLHRSRGNSTSTATLQPKPTREQSRSESERSIVVDIQASDTKAEMQVEKGLTIEEITEEKIKSVINFLKDKIPGLKVEVMNVDVTEDIVEDDSLNQFSQGEQKEDLKETDENSDDESVDFNELVTNISSVGDNGDTVDDENVSKVKVFVGEVLHDNDDASSKDKFTHLQPEIIDMKKNSFLLHVPEVGGSEDNIMSTVKVAAVVDEGASDLMPSDVAKSFMGSDKVSSE